MSKPLVISVPSDWSQPHSIFPIWQRDFKYNANDIDADFKQTNSLQLSRIVS